MGKIFYIFGKSASGKDTVCKILEKDEGLALKPLVLCTTRPKREGEQQGREYIFTDERHLSELRNEGKIIEERVYHTMFGDWYYFTADAGQIDLEHNDYLGLGTLESYGKLREYFGKDRVCPLYIEVDTYTRLRRALDREKEQKAPAYAELCRRFLADEEDFSCEKLKAAGIDRVYSNDSSADACAEEIRRTVIEERRA